MNETIQNVAFFCVWFFYLACFLRSIHIVACISTLFLLLLNNIYIVLLIHSPVDGHLGNSLWGYMNDVALNMCVQFFCVEIFLFFTRLYLGVRLLSCMVTLCLAF